MVRWHLEDMKLNAKGTDILQIQIESFADVDKSGSMIRSYPFHSVSSSCLFQAVISSIDVGERVVRPLNDLKNSNLDSTLVVFFATCGFGKHKKYNDI